VALTIFAILPIIQAKRQPRPDGTDLALSSPVALGIERVDDPLFRPLALGTMEPFGEEFEQDVG
jgi:hypothetical protein